jgi:predicted metalloprotease with PDZ domain
MKTRPAAGPRDRGGTPGRADADGVPGAALGVKLAAGSEAKLQFVFRDSPAERAGLAAGDVIIAADGLKVNAESLQAAVARRAPGEAMTLVAFRRDELMTFAVTPVRAEDDTCWLVAAEDATAEALARRQAWLGVTA